MGQAERPFGRPAFMAPEVFRRDYGPGCEVWSLGVIVHVLLTGCWPSLEGTPTSRMASEPAATVCGLLLASDDVERLRAEEVPSCPWFESARFNFTLSPLGMYRHLREQEQKE